MQLIQALREFSLFNSENEPHILNFKLADETDASFILSLRTNPSKNKYLSYTENDLKKQIIWLQEYKRREENGEELYYIVSENNIPVGTIRIYNIKENECTYGSWLFSSVTHQLTPIISEISIYEIAYNVLKKNKVLFDVMKANKNVVNYHRIKRINLINEDENNYYFSMSKEDWEISKKKYIDLLGVKIDIYLYNNNKIGINSVW